jgi:glyceraldehyde 3-phosphate dehydrogenase
MIRIGINGFGRIGRLALRIAEARADVEVVAINSRSSAKSHAHLAKYDSTYGTWDADVVTQDGKLIVNGRAIDVYKANSPAEVDWNGSAVDVVIEATGKFKNKADAEQHLGGTVKKVVVAAPSGDADGMFVMGVNEETYDADTQHVISNASCTTNCLAPIAKLLDETVGIKSGIMTTIHSFTNDQNTLDNSHKKDMRRARTATRSIIPTSTGAAAAVGKVLPSLEGKLTGAALRVPTETVSMVDLTIQTEKSTSVEELNALFVKNQSKYISVSEAPLVSIDFRANTHSSIVDSAMTQVIGDNLVKVMVWYDNEWGYTCRLLDLIEYVGDQM